ncbi:hypothetical protein AOQ84DRAFT_223108, partial [Glonium stellatum]
TALSQLYNLYFIACVDTVHVYQPTFPDQKLSNKPDLILRPPKSRPGLRGIIDPPNPHSITHLIIDFLGTEEILLVSCDDGDVIGYHTHLIHQTIETHSMLDMFERNARDVRNFFHKNVGLSAWGLSVHCEARLIAVSANTHRVTIYAFALARPGNSSSEPSTDSLEDAFPDNDNDPADFPSPRRKDHCIVLPDIKENIPSVSFNNNGTDPQGRWILSSVIDGNVYIWDILRPSVPPRKIRLAFCAATEHPKSRPDTCTCPDESQRPHGVWNAIFLDPRSFRGVANVEAAVGSSNIKQSEFFWDITNTKNDIDSSQTFEVSHSLAVPDFNNLLPIALQGGDTNAEEYPHDGVDIILDEDGDILLSEDEDDDDGDEDEDGEDDEDDEDDEDHHSDLDIAELTSANNTEPTPPNNMFGILDPYFDPVSPLVQPNNGNTGMTNTLIDDMNDDSDSSADPEEDDSDMDISDTLLPVSVPSVKRPYIKHSCMPSADETLLPPNCPILIVSVHDLFLLQPRNRDTDDVESPIIAVHDPLSQSKAPEWNKYRDCMNFLAQIPEIGVVIVGSPKGRAAVLTLTQVSLSTRSFPKRKKAFSFRLDHILPFASQERAGLRPRKALLAGIAVGPVQGTLGTIDSPRRWRLLLSFTDHSVLSYEIGKYRDEEHQGVEALVV